MQKISNFLLKFYALSHYEFNFECQYNDYKASWCPLTINIKIVICVHTSSWEINVYARTHDEWNDILVTSNLDGLLFITHKDNTTAMPHTKQPITIRLTESADYCQFRGHSPALQFAGHTGDKCHKLQVVHTTGWVKQNNPHSFFREFFTYGSRILCQIL